MYTVALELDWSSSRLREEGFVQEVSVVEVSSVNTSSRWLNIAREEKASGSPKALPGGSSIH